ncbi:YhbY family RNA-binding protein [bacterium]|nr:YhbY family RNA-binding protein [bacterium]
MTDLTSKQRKNLRGQAHHLDPIAKIGKSGVTPAVIIAVGKNLEDHELIKIKFYDFKDQRQELSAEIAEKTESHLAGIIGNVAILYKQQADPKKRDVILPSE